MRPARLDDFDAFYGFAKISGAGFTSLPEDADTLKKRLIKSEKTFSGDPQYCDEDNSEGGVYLLMVENPRTKQVLGCAAVKTNIGHDVPFFNFRVTTLGQLSRVTNRRFDMSTLVMVNDYTGASEVGTLFLDPQHRGEGAGKLLSLSRFMLMAADPSRFCKTVVSELRGIVHLDGRSPFWESVGRPFYRMDFSEADNLSATTDNQFIIDLGPKHPIYVDLLLTKPIVTVTAMTLVEEGKLWVDDPVSKYLPEYANLTVIQPDGSSKPAQSPMLVKHLMAHTSGLIYGFIQPNTPLGKQYAAAGEGDPSKTAREQAKIFAGLPLAAEPGAAWNYSRSTDVLGAVVEVASGQSLDVAVTERVTGPLGMTDTKFFQSKDQSARFAQSKHTDGLYYDYTVPVAFLQGGGGLSSTPEDYLRFAEMLRNGGEYRGVRILDTATLERMRQPEPTKRSARPASSSRPWARSPTRWNSASASRSSPTTRNSARATARSPGTASPAPSSGSIRRTTSS